MIGAMTKRMAILASLAGCVAAAGCHHNNTAAAVPQAPPPPAAPTATLAANPANIERGQSTTLSWQTANASTIHINGVGDVAASGEQQVTPHESTTYQLEAKGPGGQAGASTRVTVTAPYVSSNSQPQLSDAELFARNVRDVYFDYDRYNIRTDQMSNLEADAQFLRLHPNLSVLIEGHCDDRGTLEYNLALGAERAEAAKKTLVRLGVASDRIKTVSYGKERPFCSQDNEQCWQQNRRGHFDGGQ
jgi:peptidoglycan-associated lipoprotein